MTYRNISTSFEMFSKTLSILEKELTPDIFKSFVKDIDNDSSSIATQSNFRFKHFLAF